MALALAGSMGWSLLGFAIGWPTLVAPLFGGTCSSPALALLGAFWIGLTGTVPPAACIFGMALGGLVGKLCPSALIGSLGAAFAGWPAAVGGSALIGDLAGGCFFGVGVFLT